jgi:hypothetical protein
MEEIFYADICINPMALTIFDKKMNYVEGLPDRYGYDVDDVSGPQVCFYGWITDSECDDWTRAARKGFARSITDVFPVELFMGKKEGDTVALTIFNKKIVVTCSQTAHEYAEYGNFEMCLFELTKSFGGMQRPNYFKPDLAIRSQMAFFIRNHERYARSLDMKPSEPHNFRHVNEYAAMYEIFPKEVVTEKKSNEAESSWCLLL